jgi:peptide methionine sulfoxide reductase MsrA
VQTRVGYAGAHTESPTYRQIGDHAEVLRVVYDPASTDYDSLLDHYRETHTPRRSFGQYRSVLIPADSEQHKSAVSYVLALGGPIDPEVVALNTPEARFWDAEDYHQKYRLRRNQALVPLLREALGPRWDEHTIATRLNAAGEAGFDASGWLDGLSPETRRVFLRG